MNFQNTIFGMLVLLFSGPIFAAAPKPNILVIMADDVGWSSLGSYHQGLQSIETPHLDQLASEGLRLTDYYAQPSCTAGRSAFITGQLPIRTGLHTVGLPGDPIGLAPSTPTLANLLKGMGYTTGQFGKNHLGDRNEFLPTVHGFDEFWGWLYHLNAMEYSEDPDWPSNPDFVATFGPRNVVHSWAQPTSDEHVDPRWGKVGAQKIVDDGPLPIERQRTLEDEVTAHTLDFIRRAHNKSQPFFVWMAPARAHVWTHLSDKYAQQLGNGKGLQDVVMQELDDNVGVVLAELERLGIEENTLVIFTSDNGPETMTWPDGGTTPFHGEKGTTWEGGFRVPAVIRWPGVITPGTVNNGIFDSLDWLPTLIAAAGGPDDVTSQIAQGFDGYQAHLDGYNQLEFLKGNAPSQRNSVFYYEGTTLQAVRHNDWKAHFVVQNHGWGGPKEKLNAPLLFNLRRDPYEKAAEESGMYVRWLGSKMWAFGPLNHIVRAHLASLAKTSPDGLGKLDNEREIRKAVETESGLSQ